MATETPVLVHSQSQEVEKKLDKLEVEAEGVPAAKESLENQKPDESLCPEKSEGKQPAPPVVEEVKAVDADEKPKVEYKAEPTANKVEDKAVEPVVAEESKKIEDKLVEPTAESTGEKVKDTVAAEPIVVEEPKKIEDKLVKPLTAEKVEDKVAINPVVVEEPKKIEDKLVEPSVELTCEKVEDKVAVEPIVVKETKAIEASVESTGEKIEDKVVKPSPSVVTELTGEKIEDKVVVHPTVDEKKAEDGPALGDCDKGSQEVAKEAVAGPDTVSVSGLVVEKAERKLEENVEPQQGENQVEESKPVSIEEKVDEVPTKVVEVIEGEKTTAEQPEVVEQIVKDPPESASVEKVELSTDKSLDQVKSESPVEEKEVDQCHQADVTKKSKPAEEPAVVMGALEEKAVDLEVVEPKTEEKTGGVPEESVQYEEKPAEDATRSLPQSKFVEKPAEDVVGKNKDQTVGSTEAAKEDEKKEETVQAAEGGLEEEKQVDKIMEEAKAVKTKVQDSECKKEAEETKTAPKEEVTVVKTQKQSIVKIMKQSLVKAKKAIIGKSKTPTSEVKDDGIGNK